MGGVGLQQLVWAYGRHVNRTIANLGQTFEERGYALERFSMVVPRWRKVPAILATLRWQNGRLRAFSSIHPWTYRHLKVPNEFASWPVFVFGSQILSSAPHYFYQDLNYQTLVDFRQDGLPTYMYDEVSLSLLKAQAKMQLEHYAKARAVFTMSQWIRKKIVDTGAIPENRVVHVGAGSNLGVQFTENPYSEKNLDSERLVFIGRDFVRKGGPLLLDAWDIVRRALPTARLAIVGPPRDAIPLRDGIEAYGDVDSTAVLNLLRESAGFVLPSLWEPYGIAYLEALSCGVPVIGPPRMAIPEFLHDGQNGYLYNKDQPQVLAEAMIELLRNRSKTWEMSQNGFAMSKDYQWDRVYEKVHQVLSEGSHAEIST